MGKGKVAAQVAHAATIYAWQQAKDIFTTTINTEKESLVKSKKFLSWFDHIQKKIILKAPQSLLEELESQGYIAIRDRGFTQIPENSLTVVALGVTTREAVEDIVKDLLLL